MPKGERLIGWQKKRRAIETELLEYRRNLYSKVGGGAIYLLNDAKLLGALISSNSCLSITEIKEKSGIGGRDIIKRHLDELIKRKWIKVVIDEGKKRKKYCITRKGAEAYKGLKIEAERYENLTDTEQGYNLITPVNLKVKKSFSFTGVVIEATKDSREEKPKFYQVSGKNKPKENSFVFEFSPKYFSTSGSLTAHWTPERECPICGKELLPDKRCPHCLPETL